MRGAFRKTIVIFFCHFWVSDPTLLHVECEVDSGVAGPRTCLFIIISYTVFMWWQAKISAVDGFIEFDKQLLNHVVLLSYHFLCCSKTLNRCQCGRLELLSKSTLVLYANKAKTKAWKLFIWRISLKTQTTEILSSSLLYVEGGSSHPVIAYCRKSNADTNCF